MDNEDQTVMQDDNLGRPVRIRWIDSGLAVNGWRKAEDLPKDVEQVETVGLWMGKNDHVFMVAGSRDSSNNTWLAAQLIWRAAIIEWEWL